MVDLILAAHAERREGGVAGGATAGGGAAGGGAAGGGASGGGAASAAGAGGEGDQGPVQCGAGLLDTPGRDGWTPLGFAARSGNVAIAKALLNAGAARDLPCNASGCGKTPREIAAINAKSDGRAAALLQLLEVVQSR